MNTKTALSISLAVLLASAAGLQAQITTSWTAGGANIEWNNTDNWDVGVPSAGDSVVMDRAAVNMTVALNVQPASLNNWSSNIGANTTTVTPSGSGNRTLTINGTLTKTGAGGLVFRSNPLSTLPLAMTVGTIEFSDVTSPAVLAFGGVNQELSSLDITTANVSKLTGTGNNQLVFNPAAGTADYTVGTLNIAAGGAVVMANHAVADSSYAINVGSLNGAAGIIRARNGTGIDATVALNLTGTSNGTYSGQILDGAAITRVVKSGTATQTLGNTNSYTGGTAITGGTLVVSANNAIGAAAGDVEISGADAATLKINGNISVGNNIVFSNTNAGSSLEIDIAPGGAFRTGTSGTFSSSFAGGTPDTTATFLAGTADQFQTRNLDMSFAGTSAATNDGSRTSDVFSLTGTDTDVFVLQLSASGLAATDFLGWLDGSNAWVSAVDGNSGAGGLAGFYSQSWADFITDQGAFDGATMLGAYGNDGSGNVWAVLNHNSDFSVIPEPSTWALLAGSLTLLTIFRRRRR